MKVATTGASGSGKTTLVKYLAKELGLTHISGSAGDVINEGDKKFLQEIYGYSGGNGHLGVIKTSATNPAYGLMNQQLLQTRREELIVQHDNFITDRSPVDNLTYMINQVGFHKEVTDTAIRRFADNCLFAWSCLTHVIYIKSVQPYENSVENNGSRISNWWYQQSVDAQFNHWLSNFFMKSLPNKPKVLIIDYWDLELRKQNSLNFLNS